jgi:hypothetical protein
MFFLYLRTCMIVYSIKFSCSIVGWVLIFLFFHVKLTFSNLLKNLFHILKIIEELFLIHLNYLFMFRDG